MRPARFQPYLIDLANQQPNITATPIHESGGVTYPCAISITTPQGEARWQIIGQLAASERHDQPETPIHGAPAPSADDQAPDSSPEAWLASLITHARSTELSHLERWSTRPEPSNQTGMTLLFHNGARIYIRAL